jgi:hypothetical protein
VCGTLEQIKCGLEGTSMSNLPATRFAIWQPMESVVLFIATHTMASAVTSYVFQGFFIADRQIMFSKC